MRSRFDRRAAAACALIALVQLAGCRENPSAADVRWELERQIPGLRLERESRVRLGRLTMALARKVIRLTTEDDDSDLKIIGHVRRVDVANYKVVDLPDETLAWPADLRRWLEGDGWQTIVRLREDDGQTWVLYREGEDGSIRRLYVVTLDPSELTVIDLEGRLDRMIAEALADDPQGLDGLFGT